MIVEKAGRFTSFCSIDEINEVNYYLHRLHIKGNVQVYIERMLMSAPYYSIAHAYESIFEIYLQFVLIL